MQKNLCQGCFNEKGRYRACVLISCSDFNDRAKFVWVLPVTSREKCYPTDVEIETLSNKVYGVVDSSEIRSLDLSISSFKNEDKLQQSCIVKINDRLKTIMNIND